MGEEITLRDIHDSDVFMLEKWLYMPHVAPWYSDPLDWLDEVKKRKTVFSWIHHFIVEYEGKTVGFCQYYEYCCSGETWHGNTALDGTYSLDYLIGEADYLRKGLGKAIVRALTEKIRLHVNSKRIIVNPETENIPSCKTLEACGFIYNHENNYYVLML